MRIYFRQHRSAKASGLSRVGTLLNVLALLFCLDVSTLAADNNTEGSPGRDPIPPADAERRFAAANASYDTGDFVSAANQYKSLVTDGASSAELFFNLGNAMHRQGSPGDAALWYHRALAVEPGMPEARQNLRVIEDETGALRVDLASSERWIAADWISPSLFPVATAMCGWLAVLLITIAFCVKRSRSWLPALVVGAVFCLLTSLLSQWAFHVWKTRLASENYLIVTAADAKALVNAVPDAAPVIALPPGSMVRIQEQRGAWNYIAINGDAEQELRGWLHADLGEAVWPVATR